MRRSAISVSDGPAGALRGRSGAGRGGCGFLDRTGFGPRVAGRLRHNLPNTSSQAKQENGIKYRGDYNRDCSADANFPLAGQGVLPCARFERMSSRRSPQSIISLSSARSRRPPRVALQVGCCLRPSACIRDEQARSATIPACATSTAPPAPRTRSGVPSRLTRDEAGKLPRLPGIFPDQMAPSSTAPTGPGADDDALGLPAAAKDRHAAGHQRAQRRLALWRPWLKPAPAAWCRSPRSASTPTRSRARRRCGSLSMIAGRCSLSRALAAVDRRVRAEAGRAGARRAPAVLVPHRQQRTAWSGVHPKAMRCCSRVRRNARACSMRRPRRRCGCNARSRDEMMAEVARGSRQDGPV